MNIYWLCMFIIMWFQLTISVVVFWTCKHDDVTFTDFICSPQRKRTLFIGEHLFLSTEHGFQQGVLSGQHLQCGVKQVSTDVESDILVAQAHRSTITANLSLGTGQGRAGTEGLNMMLGQGVVPRHVPLEVDDHPADGGPKVPRRVGSYW